jgi:hypothetical protein
MSEENPCAVHGSRSRTVPVPADLKTGFCIGNGPSRAGLDLDRLRPHGIVYGCNALYRDFEPDVLVAMDDGMLLEIRQSGYRGSLAYFGKTRKNILMQVGDTRQTLFGTPPGAAWYTGPAALWIMCRRHPELERVFLVGFDNDKANLYEGTSCYEKTGINRRIQAESMRKLVFEGFPEKSFYQVGEEKNPFPEEWKGLSNIEFMRCSELDELL